MYINLERGTYILNSEKSQYKALKSTCYCVNWVSIISFLRMLAAVQIYNRWETYLNLILLDKEAMTFAIDGAKKDEESQQLLLAF